ncbi:MAG TPA: hypothetical protein VFZ78_07985 [Flavisolibacter sp.]
MAFACSLLPAAIYVYRHPSNNWDMLPYMAILLRMDGLDGRELHQQTYDAARQNIPGADFNNLVASGHREKFAKDSTLFDRILPFYLVKPLYTGFSYACYKLGATLPFSTLLPSIAAYLLTGILFFYWLQLYLKKWMAFGISLLVMYASFVIAVARIASPDFLSAFLLMAGIFCMSEKKHAALIFSCFLLAVLARLDNIITSSILVTFLLYAGRVSGRHYLLMLSGFVTAYLATTIRLQAFGWDVLYYTNFMHYLHQEPGFAEGTSLNAYLALVYSRIVSAVVHYHLSIFLLVAFMTAAMSRMMRRSLSFDQLLVIVLVLTMTVRFVLWPDLSDRFYIGFYLVFLVVFLKTIVTFLQAYAATHAPVIKMNL